MRKIDVFNHIYPPQYYTRLMSVAPDYKDIGKRMRNVPMLIDVLVELKQQHSWQTVYCISHNQEERVRQHTT